MIICSTCLNNRALFTGLTSLRVFSIKRSNRGFLYEQKLYAESDGKSARTESSGIPRGSSVACSAGLHFVTVRGCSGFWARRWGITEWTGLAGYVWLGGNGTIRPLSRLPVAGGWSAKDKRSDVQEILRRRKSFFMSDTFIDILDFLFTP